MNQVNLSTKAGKIFWASLLGYCITFGAFYLNAKKLDDLENYVRYSPDFASIGHDGCKKMVGCKGFEYLHVLMINDDTKKYMALVSVDIKRLKNVDSSAFQTILEERRKQLPLDVSDKLDSIKIFVINGQKIQESEKRPSWYLSTIAKLESLWSKVL
jgi:hypothetical protein